MDVYPLIGLIVSMNSKTLTRDIAGFVPQLVAKNGSGKKLRGGDTVYLFSYDDIAQIIEDDPISNTSENLNLDNNKDINADLNYPRLVRNFVRDNVVTINGAVWDVGAWPIGGHVSVMDVLLAAGGVTQKANPDKVEVVTTDKSGYSSRSIISEKALFETRVRAGDQVRVPEQFKQTIASAVRITGEVINPGTYDLMRGDTLLSVLERAGGVTDQAFPAGAVFSRKSERKREEQKFRAAAQNLQKTISMNLNGDDSRLSNDQVILAQGLINDLRDAKALGRITVEADPAVLIARPELNLLVENGDRIHIPKRPMNVRVSGEVMNPASLLFEENKDVDDYLAEAGGVTYYADKGRRFVVYPDGSAQPVGGWNDKLAMIIPGSTIVVPRDPKPFDFMESFKDITQILTNMAITGVFIEDIATDEN
jgi:polysaccharide export outer membrane protein